MTTAKKRQRKRKVYVCKSCGSPFSWAHTNKEHVGIYPDISFKYVVEVRCLNCKVTTAKYTKDTNLINTVYDVLINDNLVEMKSPFKVELKFVSIKVDKKTMHKASFQMGLSKHGMPAFFAYCKDRTGVLYRFGGTSATKIIYGAVKDKWFSTRICIQKFVRTNKGAQPWMHAIGEPDTIQHWRQSPKILDEIKLL